jgi:uncharacterized repeat protein (TIGR03803 family)
MKTNMTGICVAIRQSFKSASVRLNQKEPKACMKPNSCHLVVALVFASFSAAYAQSQSPTFPYGTFTRLIQTDNVNNIHDDSLNGGIGVPKTVSVAGSEYGFQQGGGSYSSILLNGTNSSPNGPTAYAYSLADQGIGSARGISFASFYNSLAVTQTFAVNALLLGDFKHDSYGLPDGTLQAGGAIHVFDTDKFNAAFNASGMTPGQFLLSNYTASTALDPSSVFQNVAAIFGSAEIGDVSVEFGTSCTSCTPIPEFDQTFTNFLTTGFFTVGPGSNFTVMFDVVASSAVEVFGDTMGTGQVVFNMQPATNIFTGTNGNTVLGITAYVSSYVGPATYTPVVLHSFAPVSNFTNSDGAGPGGLILSGNTIYGTTIYAGISGNGTVFALSTNGMVFSNLHSFTATSSPGSPNSDGADPSGDLVLLGNTLYGTANNGGSSRVGTLFGINTNGKSFTNLHSFSFSDEANPGELIFSGNIFYGASFQGGNANDGSVFQVNTNGTDITNVYNFTNLVAPSSLLLFGTTLYGTTEMGGSNRNGTVFAVNNDTTGFTNLHTFTASFGTEGYLGDGTNSDGASPFTIGGERNALLLSGNALYGTASAGGTAGNGTVFAVTTNGMFFTNLHNFTATVGDATNSEGEFPITTNGDGAYPVGALVLSGNTLYGAALEGGAYGYGTLFALNTDGTGFTTLYNFTGGSDGGNPTGLILSGNTLYGTGAFGGTPFSFGMVFSFSLIPTTPTYALGTSAVVVGPEPGSNSVVLAVTPNTGDWTNTANATWLHLSPANQSGAGSTNIVFSIDANTGATRSGALTVAGQTVSVTQAGSTYVGAVGQLTTLSSAVGQANVTSVAVDSVGDVYVASGTPAVIYKWTATNNSVTPLVTGLAYPTGVAVDGAGNVYIADGYETTNPGVIYEVMAGDTNLTTLVSLGATKPYGIALDHAGNVYFADFFGNAIDEWIVANSNLVTLVSGLNQPTGVALDAADNVYISQYASPVIDEWLAANSNLVTLTQAGAPNYGLAVDGSGNVYIASPGTFTIDEWMAAGGGLSTFFSVAYVYCIAEDGAGNIYFGQSGDLAQIPYAFVDPTPKFETAAAGSDFLPAVLPATVNLLAPFAPASDQAWLTIGGVADGVISFSFTANNGSSRTATITVLGQAIPITQGIIGTPPILTGLQLLANGVIQFAFTNSPSASFTVLSTTNLSLPFTNWTIVGVATNVSTGMYQFTAQGATNATLTFYAVRSP